MEVELDEALEEFLAELDFPYCQVHSKLKSDFICLDPKCKNLKIPLCSLCFTKLHEVKHPKLEIRNILCILIQNQSKILNKEVIIESLPFYKKIPKSINIIEKRISELEKLKSLLSQMKNTIDDRLVNYIPSNNNLKETLSNANKNQKDFSILLDLLLNTLQSDCSLKNSEFSDIEIKSFCNSFDGITHSMEIQKIPNDIENSQISEISQISEVSQIFVNDNKIIFQFDNKNKGDGIIITNSTTATREEFSKLEQRYCFITPKIQNSCQISIKISNFSNWIGIGLVRYNFVRNNNLKFLYTQTSFERGHYMISQNGYVWSDSDDNEHHRANSFSFRTGDIINIHYDIEKKQLSFKNKNSGKSKILIVTDQNDDYYVFAVALLGPTDMVDIIDNKEI